MVPGGTDSGLIPSLASTSNCLASSGCSLARLFERYLFRARFAVDQFSGSGQPQSSVSAKYSENRGARHPILSSARRTLRARDLIDSVEVTKTSRPPIDGRGSSRTRSTVHPADSRDAVWLRSPRAFPEW